MQSSVCFVILLNSSLPEAKKQSRFSEQRPSHQESLNLNWIESVRARPCLIVTLCFGQLSKLNQEYNGHWTWVGRETKNREEKSRIINFAFSVRFVTPIIPEGYEGSGQLRTHRLVPEIGTVRFIFSLEREYRMFASLSSYLGSQTLRNIVTNGDGQSAWNIECNWMKKKLFLFKLELQLWIQLLRFQFVNAVAVLLRKHLFLNKIPPNREMKMLPWE